MRAWMILGAALLLGGCVPATGALQTYDIDCKGKLNVVLGPYGGMADCGESGAYIHVRPAGQGDAPRP